MADGGRWDLTHWWEGSTGNLGGGSFIKPKFLRFDTKQCSYGIIDAKSGWNALMKPGLKLRHIRGY